MKKNLIKKVLTLSLVSIFIIQVLYIGVLEPSEISAAFVDSGPVVVSLTVTSGVSITTPSNVTMSPSISSAVDSSTGTTFWTVKTNDAAGYTLSVKASTTDALKSGTNSFVDASSTPAVWTSPSSSTKFGFSIHGTDAITATFATPTTNCGTPSSPDATLKFRGFSGTTPINVATRSSVTPTAGINTNICFSAEQSGVYAASGTYTATITATATTV